MPSNPKPPQPRPERPRFPSGYGIPSSRTGLLEWRWASRRLAASRNYWVATVRPDGRPHVMPVWGVWVNERFYFGTDRASRKARNAASNPAMVVHLESGDETVILEGVAEEVGDPALVERIDKAYLAKYGMRLTAAPGSAVIYGLRHQAAFAWREKDFNKSATRWRFDGP